MGWQKARALLQGEAALELCSELWTRQNYWGQVAQASWWLGLSTPWHQHGPRIRLPVAVLHVRLGEGALPGDVSLSRGPLAPHFSHCLFSLCFSEVLILFCFVLFCLF